MRITRVSKTEIKHCCNDLINIFNQLFYQCENTILVKGGKEPVYIPAQQDNSHHRIIFTRDYYASALHEIAHWCIAGEQRRLQLDYGYWYHPDGRNGEQQLAFEKAEAKPQALEWILSWQAGYTFKVSLDNLHGETGSSENFQQTVVREACQYCDQGLPLRAKSFQQALGKFYNMDTRMASAMFSVKHC